MNARTAPEIATLTAPSTGTPAMDAVFIERNQIVERYLAGRLPLKGVHDFERFCREHPEALVSLGLPDRINAGLRLMEAAGQPEPWAETRTVFYQKPVVFAGLAALAGTLLIAMVMLLFSASERSKRIAGLEDQLQNQPLSATQTTRQRVIVPSRTGPMTGAAASIGGRQVELADLKIDVSWSRYTNFRVTVDRVDQGRVLVLGNLQRDSNGHLRLALNSSALGPGEYSMLLEGLDWRGTPNREGWVTFAIAR